MTITEKSGQIGILMAQGTQMSTLKSVFMIQGGFIGLMGGTIGGLLSMAIIWAQLKFEILKIPAEIYFMDQIPFSFDYPAFGLILIITFIFCMVASWWPTKVVTALNPAIALGYE
jgi:lipoprotein-releasing system permease protein